MSYIDMPISRRIHRDFIQGMVKIFILHQASLGPIYGNKLNKALRSFGYQISPGSLHPLLHDLEKSGLLHSRIRVSKGRLRRYYELTKQGHICLTELRHQLKDLVHGVIFSPLSDFPASILHSEAADKTPINN